MYKYTQVVLEKCEEAHLQHVSPFSLPTCQTQQPGQRPSSNQQPTLQRPYLCVT